MDLDFKSTLAQARGRQAKLEALKAEVAQLGARREQLKAEYEKARIKAVMDGKPLEKSTEQGECTERIEALEAALVIVTRERDAWVARLQSERSARLRDMAVKAAAQYELDIAAAYQKVADALGAMAKVTGVGNLDWLLGQNSQAREIRKRLPPGIEGIRALDSPADDLNRRASNMAACTPEQALKELEGIGDANDAPK